MSFAVTRTSNGADQQEFFYSSNGGLQWNLLGSAYTIPLLPDWDLKSFDLSQIPDVDDNPDLQVRILFYGDSIHATSGNNRFDNVSVQGTPMLNTDVKNHPADQTISIMPNPARESFVLVLPDQNMQGGTLQVISINGRVIRETILKEKQTHIEIAGLDPGVYIVSYRHNDLHINKRLIVY
jgi:hypothetical protein